MLDKLPDILRKNAIETIFSTPTIKKVWPTWKSTIQNILPKNYNEADLINLGDHLSDIFQSTGGTGREQSSLSAGGTAWEALACWYINLCTVGSRIVAIRKMSLVPKPIQDAITVNYGNFPCNTESDITIIIFPDLEDYNSSLTHDTILTTEEGTIFPAFKREKLNYDFVNELCRRDFDQHEIGVIQCKTNWNDNAQIPMLWDMIYSANGFRGRNITIGREGFNIHDCANFSYSFVTVPSNQRANYSSESVAVKRVNNLSGGNYWGKETETNIARSLKEIFTNNFQRGFRNNIRTDLRTAIPQLGESLNYFNII